MQTVALQCAEICLSRLCGQAVVRCLAGAMPSKGGRASVKVQKDSLTCCLWDRWVIGWIFWRKVALKLALAIGLLTEGFNFIAALGSNWCPRVTQKVLRTFSDSACTVWLLVLVTPGDYGVSTWTISLPL